MKVRVYISVICFYFLGSLYAQNQDVRERVYVHPNTQVLISGETLRFSAFTLSDQTGKISTLSKILYVQLVGEEGAVFEQKILLEKGRGSGEFFVNSLAPTGRYQLLAYTRWMRNFGDYFQLPVIIVNPFETELPGFHEDSLTQISFHHPNDYLIHGLKTQVGFRITDPDSKAVIREGKIVDATGEVVQTFSPGENGLGVFEFRPDAKELYRVLLEDEESNISFHEFIPVRESGYDLEVKSQTNSYAFTPGVVDQPSSDLALEIYFANTLWTSRKVEPNEIQTIALRSLPTGIFQVVLTESGEQVFAKTIIPSHSNRVESKVSMLKSIYGLSDSLMVDIELPSGTYSVSIHKKMEEIRELEIGSDFSRIWSAFADPLKDRLTTPDLIEEPDFLMASSQFKAPTPMMDSVPLLPEVRNELVTASLQSTNGKPVSDVEVALSFPGKIPQIRTGFTGRHGTVLFHHRPLFDDQEVYLSVLDHESSWQFAVEEKFLTEFPPFDYTLTPFDSLVALEIQQRSIDNQIMNAFQGQHAWRTDSTKVLLPQFTQWNFKYALDDYQRFPDFKEYFIEYIIGAGIKNEAIQIRKEYYRPAFQNRQLILLDGVPVSPKRVLELDPYLVENVRVLMNRTYLGSSVFDGVVLIETYENNLAAYVPKSATKVPYQGISATSMAFDGPKWTSKKPDRRIHLYWNPMLNWEGGTFRLKSITSEVSGEFELRIEGFTTSGDPLSIRKSFQVNPNQSK